MADVTKTPTIADQSDQFEELQPYLTMIVADNGTTIGDLSFVSAQTHYSTAISRIQANNVVAADLALGLFQVGIDEVGQGWSTALTRTETSWLDSQGQLPANQVFIATGCAFQVFLRSSNSTTDVAAQTALLPSVSALQAIGKNLTWETQVGSGIIRTVGSIGASGGCGGIWSAPFVAGAELLGASGVMLGDPMCIGQKMRVPLIFPPKINVGIKVRSGTGFVVESFGDSPQHPSLPVGAYLCIRQFFNGFLCTMPSQG